MVMSGEKERLKRAIKALHVVAKVIESSPAIADTIWMPEKYGGSTIGPTLYEFIAAEIHAARAKDTAEFLFIAEDETSEGIDGRDINGGCRS